MPTIKKDFIPKKLNYFKDGDIFLADTSEDRKDCGKPLEIDNENNFKIVGGLHTIHVTDKSNLCIPHFKAYSLQTPRYHKFTYCFAEGIKVFSLKPSLFKYFTFYYPQSKIEQSKIVKLIDNLDHKIEILMMKLDTLKKYKEGLVNQVILPLFKNETLSLNDACKITTGKLDANAMEKDGKYKFFTCSRGDFFINKYAFDCEALLISGNGEVGLSKYYKGKFNAYQRTYVLYDFKIDATFIKLCFDTQINSVIKEETNKGAMPYIRLSSFSKIKIPQISNSKVNMISCVFKTIDLKIKDEENALCNIKKIKQYFLENMFI